MQTKPLLFMLLISLSAIAEPPWGTDADLVLYTPSTQHKQKKSLTSNIAKSLIRLHQKIISPADGPRSHFYPSSSQYMLESITRYGFFKGYSMGCDRLMRENSDPWVYKKSVRNGSEIKYDPVP